MCAILWPFATILKLCNEGQTNFWGPLFNISFMPAALSAKLDNLFAFRLPPTVRSYGICHLLTYFTFVIITNFIVYISQSVLDHVILIGR